MLFNSIPFLIFLVIVFGLYWFVFSKNLKLQNILLLVSSYVFYGWWDWRFLSLILISSLVDYFIGIQLGKDHPQSRRNILVFVSLFVNLGLLAFFKYFNFFVDSMIDLLTQLGFKANTRSLNIILPVGISFYTFQTLSYSLDIYRNKLKPTKDFIAFLAFVSFFPQLVAGPIERAKNLLPQFSTNRVFDIDKAKDGLRQILWGFFKKVVVADTCATNVDYIFSNYHNLDGSVLVLGTIFFAFQIYGDFSGYSDIAIGTARLFGFNLMQNFAFPYFSRDIAEFWRRWHISLSSWFRDYVYIPLGGSYVSKLKRIRNILLTFTISGFWHGANWTFIFWGFLNGLYYIPLMLFDKIKQKTSIVAAKTFFPTIKELLQMLFTFTITLFAWIFFRSESIQEAFAYIHNIFANNLFRFSILDLRGRGITSTLIDGSIAILVVLIFEWLNRKKQHAFEINNYPVVLRWCLYWIFTFICLLYFGDERTFIYFQF
jgi:alginate O-acetyltransferase complex protein AlgI